MTILLPILGGSDPIDSLETFDEVAFIGEAYERNDFLNTQECSHQQCRRILHPKRPEVARRRSSGFSLKQIAKPSRREVD